MALVQKPFSDIITFTRASGGGRFNASGQYEWLAADQPRIDYDPVTGECLGLLIEESRTNLLTYSSDFENAVWTKANVTVGTSALPSRYRNGFAAEIKANANSSEHYIQQLGPISAGTYTLKWAVNTDTHSGTFALLVGHIGETSSTSTAVFTSTDGVISATSKTNRITDFGAKYVGGGEYACWITYSITSSATYHAVRLYPENTGIRLGVGRPMFMDVAQLENGAFPTSYIPTPAIFTGRASTGTYFDANGVLKIAAAGEARYTHAYIDGQWVSAGLLLEGQRTNLLTYSSDFANAAWVKSDGAAVTPNTVAAPDGTLTADTVDLSATATARVLGLATSVGKGVAVTGSVYLRSVSGAGTYPISFYDGDFVVGGRLVNLTEAWQRYTYTFTTSTGAWAGGGVGVYVGNRRDGGTGTLNQAYIWGAQLEQGAFPTSLIPTAGAQVTRAADTSTSSQVTRAADVASVNELSPWFNASEGTLFVEFSKSVTLVGSNSYADVVVIDDGTSSNRIRFGVNPERQPNELVAGVYSAYGSAINSAIPLTHGEHSAAIAYSAAATSGYLDGGRVLTGGGSQPIVDTLRIGKHTSQGYLNGHIRSIRYYRKRLIDDDLKALTK